MCTAPISDPRRGACGVDHTCTQFVDRTASYKHSKLRKAFAETNRSQYSTSAPEKMHRSAPLHWSSVLLSAECLKDCGFHQRTIAETHNSPKIFSGVRVRTTREPEGGSAGTHSRSHRLGIRVPRPGSKPYNIVADTCPTITAIALAVSNGL